MALPPEFNRAHDATLSGDSSNSLIRFIQVLFDLFNKNADIKRNFNDQAHDAGGEPDLTAGELLEYMNGESFAASLQSARELLGSFGLTTEERLKYGLPEGGDIVSNVFGVMRESLTNIDSKQRVNPETIQQSVYTVLSDRSLSQASISAENLETPFPTRDHQR